MKQVSSSVVISGVQARFKINSCNNRVAYVSGKFFCKMNGQIVLLLCVRNRNFFSVKLKRTSVAYLATAFSIKGSGFKHELILLLLFRFYFAVFYHICVDMQIVVSNKG